MIYLPPFPLKEKVEPRLNDSVGQAKSQAHSLPDCVTQAGMRYNHQARTFLLMNAQFLQVYALTLSEYHRRFNRRYPGACVYSPEDG
jgi:hypothetical protein